MGIVIQNPRKGRLSDIGFPMPSMACFLYPKLDGYQVTRSLSRGDKLPYGFLSGCLKPNPTFTEAPTSPGIKGTEETEILEKADDVR